MTFHGGAIGQCWLCGHTGTLRVALLRVAFSDATVQVMACTGCARVAWRSVEELQFELSGRRRVTMPSAGGCHAVPAQVDAVLAEMAGGEAA